MALRFARQSASGANNGTSIADAWETSAAITAGLAATDDLIVFSDVDGSGRPVPWDPITINVPNVSIRFLHACIYSDAAGPAITINATGCAINPDDRGHLTIVSVNNPNAEVIDDNAGFALVRRVYAYSPTSSSGGFRPNVLSRMVNCVAHQVGNGSCFRTIGNGVQFSRCTAYTLAIAGSFPNDWNGFDLRIGILHSIYDSMAISTNLGFNGLGAGSCFNFYRNGGANLSQILSGIPTNNVGTVYYGTGPAFNPLDPVRFNVFVPYAATAGNLEASDAAVNGARAGVSRGADIFGIMPSIVPNAPEYRIIQGPSGLGFANPLEAYVGTNATWNGTEAKWETLGPTGTVTTPIAGEDFGAIGTTLWADACGRRDFFQPINTNARLDQDDGTAFEEYLEAAASGTPPGAPSTSRRFGTHPGTAGTRYWRGEITLREDANT